MSIFTAKFESLILSKLGRSNQAPCLPYCRVTTRGSSWVLLSLMASLLLGDGNQWGKLYIHKMVHWHGGEDWIFLVVWLEITRNTLMMDTWHDNFTWSLLWCAVCTCLPLTSPKPTYCRCGTWFVPFLRMSKVLIASFVTSIRYEVSGVIADLLLKESETQLSYSLVSLGLFLTSGFEASNGLRAVQVIFFIFTLLIPLALVTVLLILLLMPLTTRDQVRLMKVCHVLDAWAAFDVFVIAVVVANFEFWLLTEFLIYHDNIASACNWIHENLANNADCLAMQCHVQPGFILMALGGVSSYLTPKLFFQYCHGFLEEDVQSSESEEELLRKWGKWQQQWNKRWWLPPLFLFEGIWDVSFFLF